MPPPPTSLQPALPQRISFILLIACLVTVATFGGTSYRSAPGWPYLFMAGCVASAYGAATLRAADVRQHWPVLGLAFASVLLPALQLVPLPPELWQQLPGRDLVVEIDKTAGITGAWRPVSLVPPLTQHALFSMLLPFGAVLLAVQLDHRQQRHLLIAAVALIVASGLLSIIQIQSPQLRDVFGYRRVDQYLATGFLSNRNHQGLALVWGVVLSMAVVSNYATRLARLHPRLPALAVLATLLIFFALILVTGSRAGLLLFGGSVCALPLLWPASRLASGHSALARAAAVALLVSLLAIVAMISFDNGRALALSRLIETDRAEELRPVIAAQTRSFLGNYWPVGTGMGTFLPLYSLHEPPALMLQNYINQAHNDWLDLVLTGGVPAIVLLAAYVVFALLQGWKLFVRQSRRQNGTIWGRAALFVLILTGAASAVDFPLRAPFMMTLAALALVWLQPPEAPPEPANRSPSSKRARR